jgi:hypothetical protein
MATIIGSIYWDLDVYNPRDELPARPYVVRPVTPLNPGNADASLAIIASEILPITEEYEFSNVQMLATGHVKSLTKPESTSESVRAQLDGSFCCANYEIDDLPPNQKIWVSVTPKRPPFGDSGSTDVFEAVPLGSAVLTLPSARSVLRCDFLIGPEALT